MRHKVHNKRFYLGLQDETVHDTRLIKTRGIRILAIYLRKQKIPICMFNQLFTYIAFLHIHSGDQSTNPNHNIKENIKIRLKQDRYLKIEEKR